MGDSRDAVIVELGSVLEAIGSALNGDPVDDFSGSMPLVNKAVTMRSAAVHWEQIADKPTVPAHSIEMTAGRLSTYAAFSWPAFRLLRPVCSDEYTASLTRYDESFRFQHADGLLHSHPRDAVFPRQLWS